jgi:methylase of polypeptide subunit release factors
LIDPATFTVDDADVPALQAAVFHLAKIGFSESQACHRLGLADLTELRWRALPIIRDEKLAVRDRLASAIDLLLLQGSLPRAELDQLFDQDQHDLMVRAGLLAFDEQDRACARSSLFPVDGRLIFSDHAWPMLPVPGCTNVPHDQVMYIGADSRWLARGTVRREFGAALDLCTGSGVHALLAARHSKRVVAVDINPRAVQCTRFNALASGAANIEAATGDLYEPIGNEKFDLITANPPFVPSPVEWLGYRDGGRSGEDVQRRIIAGLPKHLAPGGFAHIVTEFGERDHEPLADRLRAWLDGAPLDIYILRLREHSASSYAIGHAGDSSSNETFETFLNSVQAWAANLRKQGYTRIVSVLLAFQWSDPTSGVPWTRSEESSAPAKNAGHEVEAVFVAERLVRKTHFREQLEAARLRRAAALGLVDTRSLGIQLPPGTQVKQLGKALSVLQALDLVEREILLLLEKPMAFYDLITAAEARSLKSESAYAAVISLIQRRLIFLEPGR